MGRSACWSYVTWYNKCSGGHWATWEPGDVVSLGDVGRFDHDRRFRRCETLADHEISFTSSQERPVEPRLYGTGRAFRIKTRAAGGAPAGLADPDGPDASVRMTAKREHACLLQLRDATQAHILDTRDLLTQIAARVRSGHWDLDLVVVTGRVQAQRGFAAISQGAGQSVAFRSASDARLTQKLGTGGAELILAHAPATTGFLLYEFGGPVTPVFSPPIRVKQSLWARLLPWRPDGPWLTDPAGQRHHVGGLPADLSHLPPEARRYHPPHSAMKLAEFDRMAVEDLFEEVSSLPDRPDRGHVLTWRQRKILQVIADSVQRRGYPPSRHEIAAAVGLVSTSSVYYQLAVLQRAGYLTWQAGLPRSIEVRPDGRPAIRPAAAAGQERSAHILYRKPARVPLVGQIAAGAPVLAQEDVKPVFPLPRQVVGEGNLVVMRVVGDSMINAAITDGDLVVVRQQATAENGDIVAAMIDGEAAIASFVRSDGHAWLVPRNPAYTPTPGDDAEILGRVVTVLRGV
jgi:repressor LexA